MEIRHLKLIKAVSEYKSLTRAANKLFLTQSALSHQVKEIEEEFNTRIFLRINKQMILTPAGERLLKTAEAVLDEINKNNDDIKRLISKDYGVIRIATQCYTCYPWLSSFLKKYHVKFPKVEIRIVAEATRRPMSFMEEGKLDLAIVNQLREDNHFIYQKLFEDEMVAVFPKGHTWEQLAYVTANDFSDQSLLMYSTNWQESETFKYIFEGSNSLPQNFLKLELTEAIIEMVKAGMGVSVMAKWALSSYLNSGELKFLSVGEAGYKRNWYAAIHNTEEVPEYLNEFVKALAQHTLATVA